MRQKKEQADKLAAATSANADAEMADGTKTVRELVKEQFKVEMQKYQEANGPGGGAIASSRHEHHWKWYQFAQESQLVLVYGCIPQAAILTCVPLLRIIDELPSYCRRPPSALPPRVHSSPPVQSCQWPLRLAVGTIIVRVPFHSKRQLRILDIWDRLVICVPKFLENTLKIVPSYEAGRGVGGELGLRRTWFPLPNMY
ncbi:hypothetical protein B0H13DRAFT_2302134 [Mycena leptocephala]|nr:hypothetical protein B0H13DRAFT_2302134 [Mycena leptocephala]